MFRLLPSAYIKPGRPLLLAGTVMVVVMDYLSVHLAASVRLGAGLMSPVCEVTVSQRAAPSDNSPLLLPAAVLDSAGDWRGYYNIVPSVHIMCHCVQIKNVPDIIDCNLKKDYQILIIFGKNIPDTTGHQMTI